jgi:hypothetical protein
MTLLMVQQPEHLNKYYRDLFVSVVKAAVREYEKAEKRFISPQGTVQTVFGTDSLGKPIIAIGSVASQSDYVYFRDAVSVDKSEPQVEGIVRLLGEKLAATIEAMISHAASHGAVVCYDLFALSDSTPNLKTFFCVKGYEPTLDDPTGSITGWFAYKLFFSVGTRQP